MRNKIKGKGEKGNGRLWGFKYAYLLPFTLYLLPVQVIADVPTTASGFYNPVWASELGWVNNTIFASPTGSRAYLPDQYTPWWQSEVAHPVTDYDASKLPT